MTAFVSVVTGAPLAVANCHLSGIARPALTELSTIVVGVEASTGLSKPVKFQLFNARGGDPGVTTLECRHRRSR